jgi:hypothetical protein
VAPPAIASGCLQKIVFLQASQQCWTSHGSSRPPLTAGTKQNHDAPKGRRRQAILDQCIAALATIQVSSLERAVLESAASMRSGWSGLAPIDCTKCSPQIPRWLAARVSEHRTCRWIWSSERSGHNEHNAQNYATLVHLAATSGGARGEDHGESYSKHDTLRPMFYSQSSYAFRRMRMERIAV